MKRLSLFASVLALGVGTASLSTSRHHRFAVPDEAVAQAADGAFRDGLFLGRLAAENGHAPLIASGRWATEKDRLSFTTGYQRGYSEFLASRTSLVARAPRGE
jgi:hypothetical protein